MSFKAFLFNVLCGWNSNISFTCDLVEAGELQALPSPTNLHFKKNPQGFINTLKFEKVQKKIAKERIKEQPIIIT